MSDSMLLIDLCDPALCPPQLARGFAFLAQPAPAWSTSGFAKAPECRFRSAEPVRPVCQSKSMFLADMSLLLGSPAFQLTNQ